MTAYDKFFEYEGQRISYREAEVLLAYANGCTVEQTAQKLKRSPKTIKRHRENLRLRFGLEGYHSLVCLALKIKPQLEKWVK
ncbi:MAG: helix-turn-helix transcriptional regulator [Runella sp.]